MAFCSNKACGKKSLLTDDIVTTVYGEIFCQDCANGQGPTSPDTLSKPNNIKDSFNYSIEMSKDSGLKASVSLGGVNLTFKVTESEISKWFSVSNTE